LMGFLSFPPAPAKTSISGGRPLADIMRQPVFIVAAVSGALGYGVMNLLMAATPIAMQICQLPFSDVALVLEWHVIGMFAPGFFTGHLIKRFGAFPTLGVGVVLTGSTTLSLQTYTTEEKDRAQGALNFFVFATLAFSSLASGVLVTTQGWMLLNMGSLMPVGLTAVALVCLMLRQRRATAPVA
jgi:hypothetical protein